MAGRGRGRGGRGLSFNVEALGFGRGEAMPTATAQPPDAFPKLLSKPLPLRTGEEYEYLLAMKQQFLALVQKSPFYLVSDEKRSKDIERYTDKYQLDQRENTKWQPSDWSRFPAELKPKQTSKKVKRLAQAPKAVKNEKLNERLDELEKMDRVGGEEEEEDRVKGENDEEEEEEEEDKEVEDEEDEEDNDYGQTYFDNGEDFGGDSGDDLEDGTTYG